MMLGIVKAFGLKDFRLGKVFRIMMELIIGYHNCHALLHFHTLERIQLNVRGMRADFCVLWYQAAQSQGFWSKGNESELFKGVQPIRTVNNLLQIGQVTQLIKVQSFSF